MVPSTGSGDALYGEHDWIEVCEVQRDDTRWLHITRVVSPLFCTMWSHTHVDIMIVTVHSLWLLYSGHAIFYRVYTMYSDRIHFLYHTHTSSLQKITLMRTVAVVNTPTQNHALRQYKRLELCTTVEVNIQKHIPFLGHGNTRITSTPLYTKSTPPTGRIFVFVTTKAYMRTSLFDQYLAWSIVNDFTSYSIIVYLILFEASPLVSVGHPLPASCYKLERSRSPFQFPSYFLRCASVRNECFTRPIDQIIGDLDYRLH